MNTPFCYMEKKDMKEKNISDTTGLVYDLSDMIRIVNSKQAAAYMMHGATLYDIYATNDYNTAEPILVFLFSKTETRDLYNLWLKHELK